MDDDGYFRSDRHLRAVGPDDMYMDDMPLELGARERLEGESRRDPLLGGLLARVGDAGTAAGTNAPRVLVGLGDDLEDADFFALTIPEAKSLVARVQRALDGLPLSG